MAGLTKAQLISEIDKKVKLANRRLDALEKAGLEKASYAYEYIENQWDADTRAIREGKKRYTIYKTSLKGTPQFQRGLQSESINQLRHKLSEVTKFLGAKTSTVRGTKKHYNQAFRTFEKKHKREGDYNEYSKRFADWAAFWKSEHVQRFKQLFGSSEAANLYEITRGYSQEEIDNILINSGLYNEEVNLSDIYDAFGGEEEFMSSDGLEWDDFV